MSHPTIDGGHCSEPYLPTEPAELLQSGDYATEVDVLIGEGEGRDGATFVLILVLCSAPSVSQSRRKPLLGPSNC